MPIALQPAECCRYSDLVAGFESRQRYEIFLFSKTSIAWRMPTQSPTVNGNWHSFRRARWRGLRLTTRLHLVSRLKMSGDIHPLHTCLHVVYRNRFTFNKAVQHDEVISIWLKKRPKTRQNVSLDGACRNGRCASFSPSGKKKRKGVGGSLSIFWLLGLWIFQIHTIIRTGQFLPNVRRLCCVVNWEFLGREDCAAHLKVLDWRSSIPETDPTILFSTRVQNRSMNSHSLIPDRYGTRSLYTRLKRPR